MYDLLNKIMPTDRIEEFLSVGQISTLKSGEYYIREGETPQKLAFVISGLFRYVYINDLGKEFTKGIILEHQFISSYSAMISASPSYFFIEALDNAEIFTIPYEKWLTLLDSNPFWLKFLLGFIEKGFSIKEKRERDLLLLNAETRYLNFLNEYPKIDQRINQTIIASYLGIQPESLSRIRKKIQS